MNDELTLRDYIFHFLRTPDYKTDVNIYLPKFLANDPAFSETQRVLSWEHERYRLKIIDFAKQFHPQTATWGLSVWEEELGLATDVSVDLEIRRARVMAKLLGSSPMTVANTNRLVNLFTDDGKAYVVELSEPGIIKVVIPSQTAYTDEMRDALDEMLPAHLDYYFQHQIVIDVDDDTISGGEDDTISGGDETINGGSDSVADINDDDGTDGSSAFFMQVDSPIIENIPYGKWYDATKYDGSVQAKAAEMFDNKLRYDGERSYNGINPDAVKVGNYCKWWFISDGNSSFNKEFQHNGAILYDGLRPQRIEYDDGMDELEILEVNQVVEDDIVSKLQFDGMTQFNGAVVANSQPIPTDSGGGIEITRFRYFDGAIRYDGGDMNYFNGAIRADGKFNFDSNGSRAQVETLTDSLDGDMNNIRHIKEEPLSEYSPELFDFVPKRLEKQSTEIDVNDINDTVESATDEYPSTTISKAIRYDGAKTYDGGDMNYFNGAIRADGKFTFDSSGNQAKVEVIAIDLDGSFSIPQRVEKEAPLVYVENFDFVSQVREEAHMTTYEDFEDNVNIDDGGGSLTIRRRARYDGNLPYRGNFEYTTNANHRYDGSLNYNGVCRVELDGEHQYNGDERYGGRKNHTFIEYVTDLDGNVIVVDTGVLEKIPIATRERLGLIIAGDNLDIDARGLITLPQRLRPQNMIEVEAGTIAAIFESRRHENET